MFTPSSSGLTEVSSLYTIDSQPYESWHDSSFYILVTESVYVHKKMVSENNSPLPRNMHLTLQFMHAWEVQKNPTGIASAVEVFLFKTVHAVAWNISNVS